MRVPRAPKTLTATAYNAGHMSLSRKKAAAKSFLYRFRQGVGVFASCPQRCAPEEDGGEAEGQGAELEWPAGQLARYVFRCPKVRFRAAARLVITSVIRGNLA